MTNSMRYGAGPGIGRLFSGPGPKPVFDRDDDGNNGGDDEAAKAAAAAAAAEEAKKKAKKDDDGKSKKDDVTAELEALRAKAAKAEADAAAAAAARKAAEERLKEFGDVDPAKAKELLKAQKDAEQKALEAKGDFDRVKEMMATEHKKELDKVVAEAKTAADALAAAQKQIHELTIGSSFAQSEFVVKETVLTPAKARVIYGPNFAIENGVIVGYDKPVGETGKTKLVDGSGNPLSFEAALKHLVEKDPDRDKIKAATVKAGAGSKSDDLKKGKGVVESGTGLARIQASLGDLLKNAGK